STVLNDLANPDITQTSLESNLNRLSVEVLRFVCRGMGLSEMGQKQEIVSRLLKESHNRLGREDSVEDAGVTGKAKKAWPQLLRSQDNTLSEELEALWTGNRAQCPVVGENSLDAYSKQGSMGQDFSPTEALMDKALASSDVNYIRIARQVAMERAYVVRVADENGWEVAVKMANVDGLDPIMELFGSKRESASTNETGAVVCPTNGFSATVLGYTKSSWWLWAIFFAKPAKEPTVCASKRATRCTGSHLITANAAAIFSSGPPVVQKVR
ncbi:18248_t:CDS:2, partial [Racocetra fulgida]